MKRLAAASGAAVLISALCLSGCGSSNNYGVSVQLEKICGVVDTVCTNNPELSLATGEPLIGRISVWNLMSDTSGAGADSGLAVNLTSVEIDYRTPYGNPLPQRREQIAYTIDPISDKKNGVDFPVVLFGYEQIEYFKDNSGLFPELPFQVNMHVTVHYTTSGAAKGDVQGVFSMELVY